MKVLNSIQLVAFLMASPTLLSLCRNASFQGAQALFYVGAVATFALAWFSTVLIYDSLDR